MSKHTPGPWMCRAYPQVVDLPKASKMIVIESDDENSYHIGFACSWIDNPETAKEAMANARLIAAAPDLLEALEYLAADYHRKEGLGFDLIASSKMFAAIRKAGASN